MPADDTLHQGSSPLHGSADRPYPCCEAPAPPGAAWAIDYGYCRHSLDWHGPDSKQGSGDPRCPADCRHKAPTEVAARFYGVYAERGARGAAEWAKHQKPNLLDETEA